jgi:hypothetical protein
MLEDGAVGHVAIPQVIRESGVLDVAGGDEVGVRLGIAAESVDHVTRCGVRDADAVEVGVVDRPAVAVGLRCNL